MPQLILTIFLIMAGSLFAPVLRPAAAGQALLIGPARVIDAGTVEIYGQRVRLWGIAAPPRAYRCGGGDGAWPCGVAAAEALASFLGRRTLTCQRQGERRVICEVGEEDVGAWLVRRGWALDRPQESGGVYRNEQRRAERARQGVWQEPFQPLELFEPFEPPS